MYRHCLFCQADLGANEAIEPLPVGRRVAFDAARGRLWVVCRKCERWNLTPFDARWEAIEQCERRFRATRLRVSTDNIGLARLSEGLELVRIGDPLRPEMAAWRYGDQFGRRRRRYVTIAAAGVGGVLLLYGGLYAAGVSLGGGMYWGGRGIWRTITDRIGRVKVPTVDGRIVSIVPSLARKARIQFDPGRGSVALTVKSGRRIETWRDDDARVIAGTVLPRANMSGGARADVQRAVDLVAATDTADDPLRAVLGARRMRTGEVLKLHRMTVAQRLALEMTLHEQQERRALEGELIELEARWKQAEEIAGIADSLTVPNSVEEHLAFLKHGSPPK